MTVTQEMWRVLVIYAILGSLVAVAWWAQRHPDSAFSRTLFNVRKKRIGYISTAGYSIELQRLGRDRELTYREDGRELRVWLELTGFFAPYNHVGATQDFERWTQPAKEPIPEAHQALIRSRIEQWASDQRLSIGFARGQTLEEYFAQMERDGHRRELMPDGTERWHPPPRLVLLKQLWQRMRGRT